jgi:hypothetical protein
MLKYHIQTIELTSAQASISFNSIPQDFTDLYITASLQNATGNEVFVRFNQDSGANYSWRRLRGTGTVASSDASSTYGAPYNSFYYFMYSSTITNDGANLFGNGQLHIPNYSGSTVKSISSDAVNEINSTNAYQAIISGLWNNTAPITSINVTGNGNFVAGTSISLYGVRRGSDGVTLPAAQGGVVTTSGGYTIHTFNSSGTFTAFRPLQCEYLVVAGGGGGGTRHGGGGGAGGYRSSVAGELSGENTTAEAVLSASAGSSYPIVVGSGGTGGAIITNGNSGSSSSFGLITSTAGGGGGAGVNSPNGLSGGSGGGAGGEVTSGIAGTGTTGQGFEGGLPDAAPRLYFAGGGGGAGGAGVAGTSGSNTGYGGSGISSLISGSSVPRAGGGGGGYGHDDGNAGSGGLGTAGGGNGGGSVNFNTSTSPTSGAANTGGGGGGGGYSGNTQTVGGNGGSGVVIIRYLTP